LSFYRNLIPKITVRFCSVIGDPVGDKRISFDRDYRTKCRDRSMRDGEGRTFAET